METPTMPGDSGMEVHAKPNFHFGPWRAGFRLAGLCALGLTAMTAGSLGPWFVVRQVFCFGGCEKPIWLHYEMPFSTIFPWLFFMVAFTVATLTLRRGPNWFFAGLGTAFGLGMLVISTRVATFIVFGTRQIVGYEWGFWLTISGLATSISTTAAAIALHFIERRRIRIAAVAE